MPVDLNLKRALEGFKDVGRLQWLCIILYGTTCGICIQANVAILFTAPNEVDFFCNDQSEAFKNLSWKQQKELMTAFGRCNRPDVNLSNYASGELENFNFSSANQSRKCDTGFVFDHTYMDYTLTEQFQLVCDKKWIVSMFKSIFMVGYFFGAFGSGTISDRWGRKTTMVIFSVGTVLFNSLMAFPPSFEWFIFYRCAVGAFAIGFYTTGLILHTELVRKEERKLPRTFLSLGIDLLIIVFVGVTVVLRDYRYLQTFIAVSMALSSLILSLIVPESPRWLVSQGREEDARRVCKYIAKFNSWPVEKMDHLLATQDEDIDEKTNFTHLLRTPVLRRRILLLCSIWFCHILTFYAIIFNMGTFYADLRMGIVISNIIELPCNIIPMLLIDVIGRQLCTVSFLAIGGIAYIAMGPVLLQGAVGGSPLLLGLAIFGKLMISRQFFISYIYTQELVPTSLRSQGLGLTSTISRFGGMLAPQIILLDDLWAAASSTILGAVALFAASLALTLPDTTGCELPQTIAQGENFKAKHVYKPDWPRNRKKRLSEKASKEEAVKMNGDGELTEKNGKRESLE